MSDNLQQKTFSGMVWTFARQFSLQGFGFVQGIILARLLVPKDYGLIAMTQIFFTISACFIDSGFSTALMRKKERTALDYSTVYVTNVCLTFVFALILCLASPWIAAFYHEPILKDIVIANAILLVLNSFTAVQGTRLSINLQFKTASIISVVSTVIVGVTTIILAYMGFGVWSLVYPNFLQPFIKGIMYYHFQRWFPGIQFSWKTWREFFAFGSKLLASALLNTLYENITPLVIGKKYSASDLGFYSRARGYAMLPATTFQGMLSAVTFPVLCSIQDDDERLRDAYRRLIRASAFVVFPILVGLAALARPFITVLITDKWAESIPYLEIVCFSVMWYPVHVLNLNLLQVKGRSDLFLRLEIVKKITGLTILMITVPISIYAMCVGQIFSSIISLIINTYYTGKLIQVGFFKQMRDLLPTLCYAFSMGLVVKFVTMFVNSDSLQLGLGIVVGMMYYISIAKLTRSGDLSYVVTLLNENVLKRFKK